MAAPAPRPKAPTGPGRKRADRPNRAAPPTLDASGHAAPIADGKYASQGLYGYIWAISGRAQILLAVLSVFIFLLDLVPLELQRRIVNDAIGNKIFSELIWLCGAYAVTALVQGLAKLTWNVSRNSVGEAASQRL
jgi:hypothetical protein